MWNWICSNVKLDSVQCETEFLPMEIGFVPIWNWICSNVKLDLLQCEIDFFFLNMKLDLVQCEIGFGPMWNWIFSNGNWVCSNVKLDLFQCEIRLVPLWKLICPIVIRDFFKCAIWFFQTHTRGPSVAHMQDFFYY